jgi:hypothetical protein
MQMTEPAKEALKKMGYTVRDVGRAVKHESLIDCFILDGKILLWVQNGTVYKANTLASHLRRNWLIDQRAELLPRLQKLQQRKCPENMQEISEVRQRLTAVEVELFDIPVPPPPAPAQRSGTITSADMLADAQRELASKGGF